MPKMDLDTLKAIVKAELQQAIGDDSGNDGGDISNERRQEMEYYLGEPLGNEIANRSKVISTDVSDTIESIMPDIVHIFTAGDEVVRFEPEGEEDQEAARQATEYINWIWNRDNKGFQLFHDWFKDALLQINGIIKIYWEEKEERTKRLLDGLLEDEVALVLSDDDVELLEHTANEDGTHAIRIERKGIKKRCRVVGVPPEEFLINARARNDVDEADFTAHKTRQTRSSLIKMGYSADEVAKLPYNDEEEFSGQRTARFQDQQLSDATTYDKSMQPIWMVECYIYVDFDGDGVAELRKVYTDTNVTHILDNEEVEQNPFAVLTPIRMPHRFFGRSVAELVMDIQKIKTAVLRQVLDNMYNVNNARTAINERVSLEDMLTPRPGGVVQVTGEQDIGGAIQELRTEPIVQHASWVLEYMDTVREGRTGATRLRQGLDPDALDSTASGINQLLGQAQQRILLIASIFAHTGVADAFRKILRETINHQDKERVIRLRNKWIPIDPREWNSNMDLTVHVGLGSGTKQQQAMAVRWIMEMQEKMIQYQGGANGPLVKLEHIRAAAAKFIETIGFKSPDHYLAEIEEGQPVEQPEQPPDPQIVKAQMDAEAKKGELELKSQIAILEDKRKREEFDAKYAFEKWKVAIEDTREREIAQLTASLKADELDINLAAQERGMEASNDNKGNGKAGPTVVIPGGEESVAQMGEMVNTITQELQGVAAQLVETAGQITEAVQNMNKPKEIVRGKDGRATGIRVVG